MYLSAQHWVCCAAQFSSPHSSPPFDTVRWGVDQLLWHFKVHRIFPRDSQGNAQMLRVQGRTIAVDLELTWQYQPEWILSQSCLCKLSSPFTMGFYGSLHDCVIHIALITCHQELITIRATNYLLCYGVTVSSVVDIVLFCTSSLLPSLCPQVHTTVYVRDEGPNHLLHCIITLFCPWWIFVWLIVCCIYGC